MPGIAGILPARPFIFQDVPEPPFPYFGTG